LIIFDNHLHLRRDGKYLDAIREFQQAGGTHFVLCQYPNPQEVIKEKNYRLGYHETLKMAEEIRTEIKIGVFVTIGPYPVDYLALRDSFGRETAIHIMKQGMDDAAKLCEEHRSIALGEIGRPHFPVDSQTIEDSNEILFYGMQKASDANVPVVLHTESTTTQNCKEFVDLGRKAGLPAERIVKHFAPPLITSE